MNSMFRYALKSAYVNSLQKYQNVYQVRPWGQQIKAFTEIQKTAP